PVQYAKRVVGRKIYGGHSTHIPMRVNTAGVMPIIFAQSIMFIPSTFGTFFPNNEFVSSLVAMFDIQSWLYWFIYGIMIVFFTYFYTAITFNPVDVAENMQKYGGFIPGIRPGKKTSEYLDYILTRITLPGSIFLAIIAIFPYFIMKYTNVSYNFASFYGGTGLLIVVGVALDTLQQVESHLLMRHYDGFMKTGRLRGRRRA
ncbi:MAG: preprotein translocase subunit SecY, partial [Calditrichaeota bacterium]|nr:preprotein translocase subunit SecY [Calditrichota bacterium]